MLTPKLILDFTSASFDPRITFARTGATATRVNSSGFIEGVAADTPRFDYDPGSLACRGLLIEEQRTNILQFTEALTNPTWLKQKINNGVIPVVTANAGISPSGTNNAFKVTFNAPASGDISYLRQNAFTAAAGTYTGSFYVKAFASGDVGKVIGFRHVAGSSYGRYTLTDQWQRITKTEVRVVNEFEIALRPSESTSSGTVSILFYGGQLELGAFATSYIPNLSNSTTARNADVATITGTNFSDWWQASKGGVLVRARPGTVSGTRPWVQFDDNTADNTIALRGVNADPQLYIKATTDQATIDAGTIAANTSYRLAGAWATDNCAASLNSGLAVTDSSATIPAVTQARLGSDGTNYLNGHLEAIEYWPVRLSNAGLQTASSTAGYGGILAPVMQDAPLYPRINRSFGL